MEVILSQDVGKLGKSGDIVRVKDGYARNFLIPKCLALEATESNLRIIEAEKKRKLLQVEKKKNEAEKLSERLTGVSCTVAVEAMDDDRLYGHITASEIVNALEIEGIKIDKDSIHFDIPIDKLGIYELNIKLHPEVTAKVRVWVTRK